MIKLSQEQQFAVLVDADNVSPRYINIIFDEASNYGVTTFRRIYGDWTSTQNSGWKSVLLDNSIIPIQQYSYTDGKNSTDSAMIIDAMDILYAEKVDGFILVSSDSDFTRLASRLRESGMKVVGMGESKTPSAFISACSSFKYLDILYDDSGTDEEVPPVKVTNKVPKNKNKQDHKNKSTNKSPVKFKKIKKNEKTEKVDRDEKKKVEPAPRKKPQPLTKISTVQRALRTIIRENSDDDDWISLANLGNLLSIRFPDFDVRNYGHKKLLTFVQSLDDFEVEHRSISSDGKTKQLFVRIK